MGNHCDIVNGIKPPLSPSAVSHFLVTRLVQTCKLRARTWGNYLMKKKQSGNLRVTTIYTLDHKEGFVKNREKKYLDHDKVTPTSHQ